MDTPNLDFMVSREPTSDEHHAHLEAARAELAALRAAPPKIDGVPTVPGWYWCKDCTDESNKWIVVYGYVRTVDCDYTGEKAGQISFCAVDADGGDIPSALLYDYHGPLTPPKETT